MCKEGCEPVPKLVPCIMLVIVSYLEEGCQYVFLARADLPNPGRCDEKIVKMM
jgi:hypothetical protein